MKIPDKYLTREQKELLDTLRKRAQVISKRYGGDPSKVQVEFRVDRKRRVHV